jgi:SPOR domain
MYDTRWPRPGPAMAAVAALVGLVAGVILGFSSGGPGPTAQAGSISDTTTGPTVTTRLEEFHTVVLGSFNDRGHADGTMRKLREQGVDDAAILQREDYPSLGTEYAVYSGQYETEAEAEAHKVELAQLGIRNSYLKRVTR